MSGHPGCALAGSWGSLVLSLLRLCDPRKVSLCLNSLVLKWEHGACCAPSMNMKALYKDEGLQLMDSLSLERLSTPSSLSQLPLLSMPQSE